MLRFVGPRTEAMLSAPVVLLKLSPGGRSPSMANVVLPLPNGSLKGVNVPPLIAFCLSPCIVPALVPVKFGELVSKYLPATAATLLLKNDTLLSCYAFIPMIAHLLIPLCLLPPLAALANLG